MGHAGKLKRVTVGGKPWGTINAAKETVDFSAKQLAGGVPQGVELLHALQTIVATFA